MRKKVALAVALFLLAAGGVGAALYYRATDKPASGLDTRLKGVSISTAPTTGALTTTATETQPAEETKKLPPERCWPNFGGDPQRTLAVPDVQLGRPTKSLWARGVGAMEYPPSFCDGTLYVNLQVGRKTLAVDALTGKIVWTHRIDGLMASTPAIAGPRLIVSSHNGTVTGLNRANGRELWKVRTSGKVESSPVVVDGIVYFGSTDGRLFAVDVETGRVKWAFDTGGRINASPSVSGGRVCISTYAGSIFCVRQRDGRELWSTYVRRDFARYESFYASPSTDGERIYCTARTGKVVALSAATGRTVWTQHMHALAYATPAIAHGRVYVGADDGVVRAYRATTGATLWRTSVGATVSGHALVVGNLVFVATTARKTYALRAQDGQIVWHFNAGLYSPGIATNRLYYFSLNGLLVTFRAEQSPTLRELGVTQRKKRKR